MMPRCALVVVLAWLVPAVRAGAALEDWCNEAEQLGDVAPSEVCSSHVALAGEVVAAAAPCWAEIPAGLPLDAWLAAREQCEAQAHLAVCGTVPCY